MRRTAITISLALLATLSTACGTTTGNPEGPVVLKSDPYSVSSMIGGLTQRGQLAPFAPFAPFAMRGAPFGNFAMAAVSEFSFCVTKLKLENDSGSLVQKDGANEIEASLGLIDVSNAGATKNWGQVLIPVDFNLRELSIELHKDASLCGVDYSVRFNNGTNPGAKDLSKDLEFKFEFNPTVRLKSGGHYALNLSAIATALNAAVTAGAFNDSQIGNYLTASTKGTGRED